MIASCGSLANFYTTKVWQKAHHCFPCTWAIIHLILRP
jgi:hypothetical protein